MNNISKLLSLIVVSATLFSVPLVHAATPYYLATLESANNIRVAVSNADAFSQVDFFARPSSSQLWISIIDDYRLK